VFGRGWVEVRLTEPFYVTIIRMATGMDCSHSNNLDIKLIVYSTDKLLF
jgi:hypothetical protein